MAEVFPLWPAAARLLKLQTASLFVIDETWFRLREWTYDSAAAERLAYQILFEAGFQNVDPSHPLGGRDGKVDAKCTKDGLSWLAAVYFPRGEQPFPKIKQKFSHDCQGIDGTAGFVFVTNQEVRLSEREQLRQLFQGARLEILHLESCAAILDKPSMAAVKQQFLGISKSLSEKPVAVQLVLSRVSLKAHTMNYNGIIQVPKLEFHFDFKNPGERLIEDLYFSYEGESRLPELVTDLVPFQEEQWEVNRSHLEPALVSKSGVRLPPGQSMRLARLDLIFPVRLSNDLELKITYGCRDSLVGSFVIGSPQARLAEFLWERACIYGRPFDLTAGNLISHYLSFPQISTTRD